MSRGARIAFGIGIIGLLGVILFGLVSAHAVVPSYLAAWLVLLALPAGALPVVFAAELGWPALDTPMLPRLRGLLLLMPIAAVLALPLLARLNVLYPGLDRSGSGFPALWMATVPFTVRMVVILLIWTGFALLFAKAPARLGARRGLALVGLIVHVVIGTLAALDWALAVEPGFNSSAFGLLVLVAQSGMAVALAFVLSRSALTDTGMVRRATVCLVVLLALWIFLAFTHYLVAWSANLPAEVVWYQRRAAGIGWIAECAAALACTIVLVIALPRDSSRRPALIAAAAAMVLVLHGVEMLWLVTPAFRAHFSVRVVDVLALAGIGGCAAGVLLMLGPMRRGEVPHAAG